MHRVLVVDDDVDVRAALLDVLVDHGYEAIGASNGVEALQRLREAGPTPCIIFLDLMMPLMDGIAFREEQLRNPELAEIPVVILTAYRDAWQTKEDLKPVDMLQKPVDLDALIGAARRWCEGGAAAC